MTLIARDQLKTDKRNDLVLLTGSINCLLTNGRLNNQSTIRGKKVHSPSRINNTAIDDVILKPDRIETILYVSFTVNINMTKWKVKLASHAKRRFLLTKWSITGTDKRMTYRGVRLAIGEKPCEENLPRIFKSRDAGPKYGIFIIITYKLRRCPLEVRDIL